MENAIQQEIVKFRRIRRALVPTLHKLEKGEALAQAGVSLIGGLLDIVRAVRTILNTIDPPKTKK